MKIYDGRFTIVKKLIRCQGYGGQERQRAKGKIEDGPAGRESKLDSRPTPSRGQALRGNDTAANSEFFQSSIVNREPARRGIKCGVWKRLSPVVPFAAPVAVVSAARGKTEGILLGHTTSADVMKAKFQRYSDEFVGYAAIVY